MPYNQTSSVMHRNIPRTYLNLTVNVIQKPKGGFNITKEALIRPNLISTYCVDCDLYRARLVS